MPNQPIEEKKYRIKHLDGLRGVAILLVLFFHVYVRWLDLTPWLATYSTFVVFKLGFLGVELFFLISGFVIFMTLEKCPSFIEFIFRRWLRLFPAMLVSTAIICATSFILTERPSGPISFFDILPGLLFIEPGIINRVQNSIQVKSVEGAFWTLFVEFKFYLTFGLLYFSNKSTALRNLILLFLTACVLQLALKFLSPEGSAVFEKIILPIFSLNYFGWFSLGALAYKATVTNNRNYVFLSVVLMPFAILMIFGLNVDCIIASVIVYLFFFASLRVNFVTQTMSSRVLVFIGFISYPLYLIHENAVIALTIKTYRITNSIPDFFTPWPGIFLVLAVAFFISKYLEPFSRKAILNCLSLRSRM